MSWSTSTPETFKWKAEEAIDNIEMPQLFTRPEGYSGDPTQDPNFGPVLDQVAAAKRAAKELLKSVAGPKVIITMSGHANGTGWHGKEGWSNDTISVQVIQRTEK